MAIDIKQDTGVVILGARGSGKSTIMLFLVKELLKKGYHFTIMDVLNTYSKYKDNPNVNYYTLNPHDKNAISKIASDAFTKGNNMLVLDEADRIAYTKSLSDVINLGRNNNCIKGDVIILGDNQPISLYNKGSDVLGATGLQSVYKKYEQNYNGDMIYIKANGMLPVEATPEHPILICSSKTKFRDNKYLRELSSPKWLLIKDVQEKHWNTEGDYLLVPRLQGNSDVDSFDLRIYTLNPKYHNITLKDIALALQQRPLSITELVNIFNISRAAIWNRIKDLEKQQIVSVMVTSRKGQKRGKGGEGIVSLLSSIDNVDDLQHGHILNFPLNEQTAWLLGLYVAEGCTGYNGRHGKCIFTIHKDETSIIRKIEEIAKELTYSCLKRKAGESNGLHLDINSVLLAKAFDDWCGHGAHNKKIPEFILLHNNLNILREFLHGYITGDGCIVTDNRDNIPLITAATTSKILTQQLQLAYARLGVFLNINITEASGNNHESYNLSYRPERLNNYTFVMPDYIATPIREKAVNSYSGKVYNLASTDNTYLVSNVIVHNCGYMVSSRRTANIPKDYLASSTYAFVFKSILPQDLKVLTEWFDTDEETFRSLQPHEFIVFYYDEPVFRGRLPASAVKETLGDKGQFSYQND